MISRALPLITHRISFSGRLEAAKEQEVVFLQQDRELTPSVAGSDDPSVNHDSESELSGLFDSDSDIKISKPFGEPGRPRSGGYNIEAVLAPWGRAEFIKVNKFVKKLADAKLDLTKSYSKQNGRKVADLCETVEKHHPIVKKYEDHWPIRAMLKLYLKATSETRRRSGNGGKYKVKQRNTYKKQKRQKDTPT